MAATMRPLRHPVVFGAAGQRTPATLLAIDERNRWLAEAAALFMPDQSSRATARRLHVALARYRQGPWRRHRVEDQCPARLRGRIEQYLWLVLRARDAIPSESTVRAAIDAARKSPTWRELAIRWPPRQSDFAR
jgi:hypothetical protein